MASQIIKELTAIKNTNKVTNEQVLLWAEQKEAQRSLEAVLDSLKDNKEFNTIESMKKLTMPEMGKKCIAIANTVGSNMNQEAIQHMARTRSRFMRVNYFK